MMLPIVRLVHVFWLLCKKTNIVKRISLKALSFNALAHNALILLQMLTIQIDINSYYIFAISDMAARCPKMGTGHSECSIFRNDKQRGQGCGMVLLLKNRMVRRVWEIMVGSTWGEPRNSKGRVERFSVEIYEDGTCGIDNTEPRR